MTTPPPDDAWTPFRGPDFLLELPAGWTVDEDEHGLIGLEGGGASAAIWPLTQRDPAGENHVRDLLSTLAGRLRQDVAWRPTERLADHVWAMEGDASHRSGFARLVLGAPTPQGQPVWLFLATAADRPGLEALRPVVERIFRSYRPVAENRATGGAADEMAGEAGRFVEPTEHAFTVTVPSGWQAQAGVVRYGVFGTPWLRLLAADGAEIRDVDPRWPLSYLEPNPTTHAMGQPVGSVTDGVMIRPFTPPGEFAAEYASWMARERGEEGIRPNRQIEGPAVLERLPTRFRAAFEARYESALARQRHLMPHVQVQASFGAVDFTTSPGGQAGLIFNLGSRSAMPGSMGVIHTWVAGQFGFLGPAQRRDEMERALFEVGASKRIDPRWEQQQERAFLHKVQRDRQQAEAQTAHLDALTRQAANAAAAAQRSRNVTSSLGDTYSEISDITHQGYMDRQRSSDGFQRRAVNAIHEQVDVFNPATGDVTYGVPGHAQHYFVDAFGNTVGTEIDDNPDPMRFTRGQNLDDLYDTGGS